MIFDRVLHPFIEKAPVSVMFRAALENVFAPELLDEIFGNAATRQVERQLLFSTCGALMSLVVSGASKSVNSAYREMKDNGQISVSVKAVYDKLSRIEPAVCERMVRETAARLAEVHTEMGAEQISLLSGYEVRILDGNHLAATQHRIKELRPLSAAALPGQSIVILNPQVQLAEDVITCENGHAHERSLTSQILERIQPEQCWVGDTAFCTRNFMYGCVERKAYFVVRHHGSLKGKFIGDRQKLGRTDTGIAYEQVIHVDDPKRGLLVLRRITIVRDAATQKGASEVHLLTNVPKTVCGKAIASVYRKRWTIETAFQDLATTLRGEINTLGYPDAALFGFCIAVMLFNVFSVLKAAITVAAGGQKKLKRNLSTYYLADRIAGVWKGMEIVVPAQCWTDTFASLTPKQLAQNLLQLAKNVRLEMFYTNRWTPKKPKPPKIFTHKSAHVATQELLDKRGEPPEC